MDILVVPVNNDNFEDFYDLFDAEEYNQEIKWPINNLKNNLQIGSFVFFPEFRKIVRAYKVINIKDNYVILSKAIADFSWKDWNYVANSQQKTLSRNSYIITGEKTRAIYNFFNSKIN